MNLNKIFRCSRSLSSNANAKPSTIDYCINLVQKRAYEQYLATLLLPPKIRRCGFAIRAFNVEISSIRDQVSQKHAGIGRMVFWRELVNNIYIKEKPIPSHPVAKELYFAVHQHSLSQELLLRMIEAREVFINDDLRPPFDTVEDVNVYSKAAFSSLYYILLESILDASSDNAMKGHSRHAATQLGVAEGIVTLLRGIPHNASALKKVYLPISSLAEHKVSTESIVRRSYEPNQMQTLVESLAAVAEESLNNARFRSKYLSHEEKCVLLPAVTIDRFLTRLSRVECDIFDPRLQC